MQNGDVVLNSDYGYNLEAIEAVDEFAKENDCQGFGERQPIDTVYCESQVARTTIFYVGCVQKLTTSKDYTNGNMSDDIVREVRLLNAALAKHGGLKQWMPVHLLAKINKIVMEAR